MKKIYLPMLLIANLGLAVEEKMTRFDKIKQLYDAAKTAEISDFKENANFKGYCVLFTYKEKRFDYYLVTSVIPQDSIFDSEVRFGVFNYDKNYGNMFDDFEPAYPSKDNNSLVSVPTDRADYWLELRKTTINERVIYFLRHMPKHSVSGLNLGDASRYCYFEQKTNSEEK